MRSKNMESNWSALKEYINSQPRGALIKRKEVLEEVNKNKYLSAGSFDRYCKMLNQLAILDKTYRGEYQIIQHIPEAMNTVVLLNLVSRPSWKDWFIPVEERVNLYYDLKNFEGI
jgi:hypothetical protein